MAKESVLDLVFTRGEASSRFQDWQTLPYFGSDHLAIMFTLSPRVNPIPRQIGGFNTKSANWEKFSSILKARTPEVDQLLQAIRDTPAVNFLALDKLAERFTSLIQDTAKATILRRRTAP